MIGKTSLAAALGSAALLVAGAAWAQTPAAADNSQDWKAAVPRIPGQNVNGMRVYIRAGLKTHAPGEHDYPQFLADFSKVLTRQGAVVDGSLHEPTAAELERTDVLVVYKGDAGFMSPEGRAALQAFVKRGGGIVVLHDGMCGPDPKEMARYLGGAKKHGEVNYTLAAKVPYTIIDRAHPVMQGMTDMTLQDEAFFNMTWSENPKINVLATAVIDGTPSAGAHKGEVVPQIWTYEHQEPGGKPARSFTWMQGHNYSNIANPQIEAMLLRAIAWAGHRPANELVDYKPPPRPARRAG
jgi:type 1 glutamine amidotransferase